MADDDLVDVVDEHDQVVAVVTRKEMRARHLPHRAVYVVVRSTAGSVVVHQRAAWKDVYPSAWDICFGGVLDAGEDWDHAAARELAEEAGIDAPLRPLGRGQWTDGTSTVVGRIYECTHDGPYPCPDGEVVAVRVVPLDELDAFLARHEHCPDSAALARPLLR